MTLFLMELNPVSCHFFHLTTKYLPHHLIFDCSQPISFHSCERSSFVPT